MSVHTVRTRLGPMVYEATGSGPPLVLLHANGHDRRDFDAVVPALSAAHTTLAFDWPGMGESPAPLDPRSVTAAKMADVLEDVVDELRLPPSVFVGNSIGGFASLRLAARRPHAVRALVPVDPGGFTARSVVSRSFCWLKGHEWFTQRTIRAFTAHVLKRRNWQVETILRRVVASHRRPATVAVDAAIWRSFPRPDSSLQGEAPRVTCPTMLVWGKQDPVLRAQVEGAAARRALPGARWVELDTGHAPFAEDPAGFLGAVLPFLQALPWSYPADRAA
ncbi:MAG TPA: alpha/beta hydrolase [Polyangiaceae bacterium]|jgi:pimeloyl-ACP methyl ester carboxylesterase